MPVNREMISEISTLKNSLLESNKKSTWLHKLQQLKRNDSLVDAESCKNIRSLFQTDSNERTPEESERDNQLLNHQCAYSEKITPDAKVQTEFDLAHSKQSVMKWTKKICSLNQPRCVQVKDQPLNRDPNEKIGRVIPESHDEQLIKPEQDRASLQSEQSYPNERIIQNIQATEQENAIEDEPKILLHDEPKTCSAFSSNTSMTAKKEKQIKTKTEKNVQAAVPLMDQILLDECMKVAGKISQLRNLSSAAESFTSTITSKMQQKLVKYQRKKAKQIL
jgi:hypothetical protein